MNVRPAEPTDFEAIEALIAGMFSDLGTIEIPAGWSIDLRSALDARLGDDVAAYVTTDVDGTVIAVAVGVIDCRLPSPRRPSGRIGYVEWLATDARHRRRGAARAALDGLLAWFDRAGIGTVDVHASEAARPLYVNAGFAAPHAVPLRRTARPAGPNGTPG